ncbi:MAG: glycosyltransferase family 39 protein, partial [Pseudomonadota bacterium]
MARAATAKAKRAPGKAKRRAKPKPDPRPWWLWTLAFLAAFLAVRLAVNAAELVPVHFDEAQYWAYGQELAWGYFSKPPLVGAAIRLTTDLFGDTLFALRIASPVAHALVAWLIFATARRLFDGRTGFGAAVGYTAAPGVGVSSMIVSTDPIMMVFWGLALYGTVRAREGGAPWWALVGAAIGAGMLAKYTMVAFAVGLLGWVMLSAERRDWRGLGIAALAALVVFSPNLLWNLQNGFAT